MKSPYYIVYSSFNGWKIIGVFQDLSKVIDVINKHIYIEKGAQYIITENHPDLDMQFPYETICSKEDFLEFVELYKEKQKIKKIGQKRLEEK